MSKLSCFLCSNNEEESNHMISIEIPEKEIGICDGCIDELTRLLETARFKEIVKAAISEIACKGE